MSSRLAVPGSSEFGTLAKPKQRPAAASARRILRESTGSHANKGNAGKSKVQEEQASTPKIQVTGTAAATRKSVRPSATRPSIVARPGPSLRTRLPLVSDSTRKRASTIPVKASPSLSSLRSKPPLRPSDAAWEDLEPSSPGLKALQEPLADELPQAHQLGHLKTPRSKGSRNAGTAKRKSKLSSTLEDLLSLPLDADMSLRDSPSLAEISMELDSMATPIQAKTNASRARTVLTLDDKKTMASQLALIALLKSQLEQAQVQAVEAGNRAEILSFGHEEELKSLCDKITQEQERSAELVGQAKRAAVAVRWEELAHAMAAERAVIKHDKTTLVCLAHEMDMLEGMLRRL